jgi:hypothetical protein
LEVVLAVLASYGLRGEEALHAAREFRSESFDQLFRAYVTGLRNRKGEP